MATSPFMKFYFADYDAKTAHLTTLQHGAYFLLIKAYWQSGEPLPDNDSQLARIAGTDRRNWKRHLRPVMEQFFTITVHRQGHTVWVHSRVEDELEIYRAISNRRKVAGRKGGKAKALASASHLPTESESESERKKERTNGENLHNLESSVARADAPRRDEGKEKGSGKKVNGHPVKATRLPPEWMPSEDDCQIGIDLGLTPAQIEDQHMRFQDYWIARPGAGGTKLNWGSTFRNWLRKAADDKHARR